MPWRGQVKVRTEKHPLDLATKTSTVTLVRADLANRSGQNETAKGWD